MLNFIITLVVTAFSLILVSKLPLGVRIDSFGIAIIAALVFGLLNAFIKPVLSFLSFPITLLTLGLFSLVINAAIFGLAAALVRGFTVNGFFSALLGALVLSIVTTVLFWIIPGDQG